MAKREKRNRKEKAKKAYDFYEFISNIVDIISTILSPKVIGTLALVAGAAAAGGFYGYRFGFNDGFGLGEASVTCEVCPEPIECPEIPVCPDCPRPIESYTCEEIDAAREDCLCVPF